MVGWVDVTARSQTTWSFPEERDSDKVSALSSELNIGALTASVLIERGFDSPAKAASFLRPKLADLPKPTSMAGLNEAVGRLAQAVDEGEKVTVFGDYDADGLTATALVVHFLRSLEVDVSHELANRFEHGYGLPAAIVKKIAESGCSLLVVVDCGTSDLDSLEMAKSIGLDVLVVDHHPPSGALPPVVAMMNPLREECSFADKGMASVGLAFYLMAALRTRLGSSLDVRELLDLVAVGTVADVSPLRGANRILVRHGLSKLGTNPRPGLAALFSVTGAAKPVTSRTIGFQLGPRINAAGRLGKPDRALELLLATDPKEALELARELDQLSIERRSIQDGVTEQALPLARAQVDKGHAMVLVGREGWHQGVVGIVAARICDELHCPAAVVSFEESEGRASARAPSGIDLHALLQDCAPLLERFGGHAAAAGFTVEHDNMVELHKALDRAMGDQLAGEALVREIVVDAAGTAEDLSLGVLDDMEQLGPFGAANPEPVILLKRMRPQSIREVRGGHISGYLECDGRSTKVFGPGMGADWPKGQEMLDVVCHLRLDTYRGAQKLELQLLDVRPSSTISR